MNDDIKVSVEVKNTGALAGDEVVQLYVSHEGKVDAATRTLVGFERIHLNAGETKTLTYNISPKQYALIGADGNTLLEPGALTISVGGKQPGFKGVADTATSNVLTKKITLINNQQTQ